MKSYNEKTSDEKTSDEIEREVESSRANVQNTLRELSDRMSPGQLVDQAFGYMKTSGGAEFANNLGRQVRDNPLPLLLIGAGIGWLMMGGQPVIRRSSHGYDDDAYRRSRGLGAPVGAFGDGVHRYDDRPGTGTSLHEAPAHYQTHSSSGPSMTERLSGAAGAVGGAVRSTGSTVTGAARSTGQAVSGAAHSVGHAASSVGSAVTSVVSGAANVVSSAAGAVSTVASTAADAVTSVAGAASHALDSAAHMASSGYGSALRGAHGARHSLSDAASGLSSQAGDYSHSIREQGAWAGGYAQERWSRVVEDQPLVLGGVGLAIGAALGAVLPTTRAENELIGETSDRVKAQIAEAAQEQYEHAKQMAGETYQEVADSLNESGIKEQVAQTINTAAEKFRETATTAAGQAKEHIGSFSETAKQRIAGEQDGGQDSGSGGGMPSSTSQTSGSGSEASTTAKTGSSSAMPTSVGSSATNKGQSSHADSTSTPLTSGSGSGSTSGLGSTSDSGSAVPTSNKTPALGELDKKI